MYRRLFRRHASTSSQGRQDRPGQRDQQGRQHRRHRRPASLAFAGALVAALALAGCSNGSGAVPRTVTKVITAAPSTSTGSGGGTGITVVAPSDLGTGTSGTAETTGAATDTTSQTGESGGSTTETTSTTSTTSTTTTLPAVPPAVATILESGCPSLLTASDISAALGKGLPDKQLRVVDVQNPGVEMTGRTRCYYGTDDLTVAKPLAVALAAYASADAAQSQLEVTVQTETGLGARAVRPTVNGHPTTVLLRDGGLLVMQQGTWTLSIALADGVIPAGQLSPALQKLAIAVLKHVAR